MRFIRDFIETIMPSGQARAAELRQPPIPVPAPEGNVSKKKIHALYWVVGGFLLLVFLLNSWHSTSPGGAPIPNKNRNALQFQSKALTPEEVAQSGQQLQAQTTAALLHDQELKERPTNSFGANPENAGMVDPNREATLRRLNESADQQGKPSAQYQAASGVSAAQAAADAKKERELKLEKALHASPYVAPVTLAALAPSRSSGPASANSGPSHEEATEETRPVSAKETRAALYDWSQYDGKLHRLLAGTVLRGVTKNGIEGSYNGPVVVQLTDDVYSQDRQELIVKAGSVLIGTAHSVSSQWQSRIDVRFRRVIMPDGFSQALQDLPGLSQKGEMGITDKVNRHYGQTFAAALVVGAIGGLSQIGNGNYGGLNGIDPSTSIRNGISQSTGQSAGRLLEKYADRPPTISIRPGSRVSLILDDDILLPEYLHHLIDKDL